MTQFKVGDRVRDLATGERLTVTCVDGLSLNFAERECLWFAPGFVLAEPAAEPQPAVTDALRRAYDFYKRNAGHDGHDFSDGKNCRKCGASFGKWALGNVGRCEPQPSPLPAKPTYEQRRAEIARRRNAAQTRCAVCGDPATHDSWLCRRCKGECELDDGWDEPNAGIARAVAALGRREWRLGGWGI